MPQVRFIYGALRSGTTLLADILMQNPVFYAAMSSSVALHQCLQTDPNVDLSLRE